MIGREVDEARAGRGEPLAVMAMVVAPFLRAMSAASIRSRVRPELR